MLDHADWEPGDWEFDFDYIKNDVPVTVTSTVSLGGADDTDPQYITGGNAIATVNDHAIERVVLFDKPASVTFTVRFDDVTVHTEVLTPEYVEDTSEPCATITRAITTVAW